MNTLGTLLRITLFGSSHGPCVGVVVDGVPSGTVVEERAIQLELDRRKPGKSPLASARKEEDRLRLLSGVVKGRSTGLPITMLIENTDVRSQDYADFNRFPRPGHADYPQLCRFGEAADIRGGGQSSGRMTAGLVMAGALARTLLEAKEIAVAAHSKAIGGVEAPSLGAADITTVKLKKIREKVYRSPVRVADARIGRKMERAILAARRGGDSIGGIVECAASGLPPGLGEPFFDSVEGELAKLLFAVPAVKGVEFGAGFGAASMRGSAFNDPWAFRGGKVVATRNSAGGVLGGLTTGMPLVFRAAFRPPSSIPLPQQTVDLKEKKPATLRVAGRHDPCIVPRAVPVVEACACLVLADLLLRLKIHARRRVF